MNIPYEKIKSLRIQNGISQVDMANAAFMSRSAYIAFEKNGSENLPLKSAFGLAKALGLSFNELFEVGSLNVSETEDNSKIEILEEQIQNILKRADEREALISHLQRDNSWLRYENALYRIFSNFIEIIKDELLILGVKEPERLPHPDIRLEGLKEIIESFAKAGYPDKKNILRILFENIDFIEFIELKSFDKKEFIKNSTLYINKFMEIDESDVEKFVQLNVQTKWDPKNLMSSEKRRNDFFNYWKDID